MARFIPGEIPYVDRFGTRIEPGCIVIRADLSYVDLAIVVKETPVCFKLQRVHVNKSSNTYSVWAGGQPLKSNLHNTLIVIRDKHGNDVMSYLKDIPFKKMEDKK